MLYKIDMHIHCEHSSDGRLSVQRIFELARARGINGIAISDHNTARGGMEAAEKAPSDLLVIPAAEMSTEYGHILCYFLRRDLNDCGAKKDERGLYRLEQISQLTHEQGGLVFAAHPYRTGKFDESAVPFLDGVEIYNARNSAMRQHANLAARALARKYNLPFSAGSDCHIAPELGRGARLLELPQNPTEEQVKQALMTERGSWYEHFTPLRIEGWHELTHYIKRKNKRGTIRSLKKLGYSTINDTTALFRGDTRQIIGGKIVNYSEAL